MNYYEYFKSTKGNRDTVFQDVLARLNGKSASILEVGCSRDLSNYARQGDGWSSFHFLEYVAKHGHALHICDIDQKAIDNCWELLNTFPDVEKQDVCLYKESGVTLINSWLDYHLYYLDGSNNPQEMVDEYEGILKLQAEINSYSKTYFPLVLCDDFQIKGTLIREKYTNFLLYKWENSDHEMALYGAETGVKILKKIQ